MRWFNPEHSRLIQRQIETYEPQTHTVGHREGINIFLAGFVPTENLRFREEALTFKVAEQAVEDQNNKKFSQYTYPSLNKTQGNFTLNVSASELLCVQRSSTDVKKTRVWIGTLIRCSMCTGN